MSRAISSALLALALALPAGASAAAVPVIPELFWGTAPGRVGSEIDALVGGRVVASTTLAGGTYGRAPHLLLVSAAQPGEPITFAIGGAAARQSARFESGAITELDLALPPGSASSTAPGNANGPAAGSTTPQERDYDLDGDRRVDRRDLAFLLARWGLAGLLDPADLDGDGTVGLSDFNLLLLHFSL
ncbi:MAG TPA: hypothetical protein VHC68_00010 [Candidatus Paceibacterota bacterium]|nr:hypothetical protein [Candidatus Paceibacterota bacterium]